MARLDNPRVRLAALLAMAVAVSEAFVAPGTTSIRQSQSTATETATATATATSLSALPPPLIIGPMLKKMRAEKEKKNQPLANPSEAANEAPGLKVGTSAWKWPSVWPYDDSFFALQAESSSTQSSASDSINNMASMLTGIAKAPEAPPPLPSTETDADEEQDTKRKFDPIRYWNDEHATQLAATELDADAKAKLQEHYSFYLCDGMSVLELGAGANSYLPEDLKLSRHVGVGASESAMKKNAALTESMAIDLNNVIDNRDVDSDDLRKLATEPFDVILLANTVAFLTSPREVFRSAWYLLKPGGTMIVAFPGKDNNRNVFGDAQTKLWRDYNDDQHLWMTGSFFQFSAGDGWEALKGFDISPDSAKAADAEGLDKFFNKGKDNNLYVVQATKGYQDETINPDNYEDSIRSLCWMLPTMEERDKNLVVPRLARACETATNAAVVEAIERNIHYLPFVYETLIKMDQFSFTFGMQAQMAADVISNPDFGGSEEEIMALKQGLGLRTPSKEFWAPVGESTSAIPVEDKISLLAYIIPCFGSGDAAQEEGLRAFVSGLKPTYAVIRSKCADWTEAEVQLLGAELLATEVLKPGRSTRQEFAAWLAVLSDAELRELLMERKSVRERAKSELGAFRQEKADKKARYEEYQKSMTEQIEEARRERSLIFNPKTEKMEVFENPSKK
jgi:SAM-dependent methyltransferase